MRARSFLATQIFALAFFAVLFGLSTAFLKGVGLWVVYEGFPLAFVGQVSPSGWSGLCFPYFAADIAFWYLVAAGLVIAISVAYRRLKRRS